MTRYVTIPLGFGLLGLWAAAEFSLTAPFRLLLSVLAVLSLVYSEKTHEQSIKSKEGKY